MAKIKPRERDAIIQALHFGLTPRIGIQYIQVGRNNETEAIKTDLDRIKNNGTTIRFIIGNLGSGKSFFLTLSSEIALTKKFVVTHADISQEHLLHSPSNQGKARALYSELMHNLAVKVKWEGGALRSIIERYISDVEHKLRNEGKEVSKISFQQDVKNYMYDDLRFLQNFVNGSDFALVLGKYFEGYQSCNDNLMDNAIKWLSGEYTTKTQAKSDLGVRTLIDDNNYYDYLKLWAQFFVQKAGYSGFLVNLDEMGTISQNLNNAISRDSNYKKILDIVNDCIQGETSGIGFIFAGTTDFLDDKNKGIASYPSLNQRLRETTIEKSIALGFKDYTSPVMKLENLSKEETYVLLENIRNVFAYGDPEKNLISDKDIEKFLNHCARSLGSDLYQGPREITKGFVKALSMREKDPATPWEKLLGDNSIIPKKPDGKLANLKL